MAFIYYYITFHSFIASENKNELGSFTSSSEAKILSALKTLAIRLLLFIVLMDPIPILLLVLRPNLAPATIYTKAKFPKLLKHYIGA